MPAFFQEIIALLIKPPGNLIYHAVIAFSIAGALPAAIHTWRDNGVPQGRRILIGLTLLLIARLGLFLASGIAWQGLFQEALLLPSIDRAVTLFSLIIICWLWTFPDPSRLGDAVAILLALFTLTLATLSGVWWYTQATALPYNGSLLDRVGEAYALTVLLLAIIVLLVRRAGNWGVGLAMLSLLFLGHLAHFLAPLPDASYPASVRLFQMLAYPLLLALPQRLPGRAPTAPAAPAPAAAAPRAAPAPRYSIHPRLLTSLLALSADSDLANLGDIITSAVAQTMLADLCLFVSSPAEDGQIVIHCYYDLIREANHAGAILPGRQAPVVASALRHGRTLRLPESAVSPDQENLARALDLERTGHLLIAPILSSSAHTLFGLILLSPYTRRAWTSEDQATLTHIARSLAQLLQHNQMVTDTRSELARAQQALEEIRLGGEQAQKGREALIARLEAREKSDGRKQPSAIQALIAAQDETQRTITQLESEIDHLHSASLQLVSLAQVVIREKNPPPSEAEQLQGELRLALEEVARLRSAFVETDQKPMQAAVAGMPAPTGQIESFAAIAQEMRQPLASILGYADFLLGESVGILGALQRKFLERIRLSTERMSHLIDELNHVSSQEMRTLRLDLEPLNLQALIDHALANTRDQFVAADVELRLEIPSGLPDMLADHNALLQVLTSLLENAARVSPPSSQVTLHVEVKGNGDDQRYVLIQVSDQGGGIQPQDLPRVFSRLYRHPIPGVGETGAGLSIVKTLVEALQGRVWVDSLPGKGATFSLLLPIDAVDSALNDRGDMA